MELNLKEYIEIKKEKMITEIIKLKNKNIKPVLNIFTDDMDFASQSYMKSKTNLGKELGIEVNKIIIKSIYDLIINVSKSKNKNETIILQQPFQNKTITETYRELKPENDVDGFFKYQEISEKDYTMSHCTAHGMLDYIKYYFNGDIREKNIVLVGRGELTNKPLSLMLINEGATVIIINSKTSDELKNSVLKLADVVVCSSSVKGSVKSSQLNDLKKVLVINCGIVRDSSGKLDTELEIDVEKQNIDYTPRIKGVGQLTTLFLFENVINYYNKQG